MALDPVSTKPLISSDIILLLLAAPGGGQPDGINGITRLEKLLFLVDQETETSDEVEDPFRFEPYDYGPYSKEVYEAVELLEELGLVNESRAYWSSSLDELEEVSADASDERGVERCFTLTDDGKYVAHALASEHPDIARRVADVKRRYAEMPLRQLIRYVYTTYPESAKNSVIRREILGH